MISSISSRYIPFSYISAGAEITIDGYVNITGSGSGSAPIKVTDGGTVNISGGTITSSGQSGHAVYAAYGSTVNFISGNIIASGNSSVGIYEVNSTVYISDGNITAINGVYVRGGTVTISGGTFTGDGVYLLSGTINLSPGPSIAVGVRRDAYSTFLTSIPSAVTLYEWASETINLIGVDYAVRFMIHEDTPEALGAEVDPENKNRIILTPTASGTYILKLTAKDGETKTCNLAIPVTVNKLDIVDIAAIPGVTPPATGATPVTTIAGTAQYTGTVTWTPNHTVFAGGTVYTATITLTPAENYTLNGVPDNFFSVAGATSVTNDANSGVVTAVFPATEADPPANNPPRAKNPVPVQSVISGHAVIFMASDIAEDADADPLTITALLSAPDAGIANASLDAINGTVTLTGVAVGNVEIAVLRFAPLAMTLQHYFAGRL